MAKSSMSARPAVNLLLLCLAGACAERALPASKPPASGDVAALVSTERLAAPPFMVLARVRGKRGNQAIAFECEVRFSHGRLTLLGMTDHDPHAFEVQQRGMHIHSRATSMRGVLLEPVQLLYDVHRAFFYRLPPPQRDGVYELIEQGEAVRERWRGGHVVERRFHALETFAKLSEIRFSGAPAPVVSPRMQITNLHYGYTLDIETLEQQHLDADYALDVTAARAPLSRESSSGGPSR